MSEQCHLTVMTLSVWDAFETSISPSFTRPWTTWTLVLYLLNFRLVCHEWLNTIILRTFQFEKQVACSFVKPSFLSFVTFLLLGASFQCSTNTFTFRQHYTTFHNKHRTFSIDHFTAGLDASWKDAYCSCYAHHVNIPANTWPVWLYRTRHKLTTGCHLLLSFHMMETFQISLL